MEEETREPQYQVLLDLRERYGLGRFGLMSSQVWGEDPKRILFLLARYKFVAKMLAGCERVLEIGCADAFGTGVQGASDPQEESPPPKPFVLPPRPPQRNAWLAR